VVVNPVNWRAVYLRRDTTNACVHSSPLAQAPLTISGCAVVFSTSVATGQALLIDSRFVDHMPSSMLRIELAHVASQFLTGEITVRAEMQPAAQTNGTCASCCGHRAPGTTKVLRCAINRIPIAWSRGESLFVTGHQRATDGWCAAAAG
jgi:hypothetical protein